MAKVSLDYSSVGNSGLNNIDNLIGYLNQAINFLQQHSIPSDFSKRSSLVNTIDDLRKQRNRLSAVKDWLVSSNANYNSMIDKLNSQANKLPVGTMKTRNTRV